MATMWVPRRLSVKHQDDHLTVNLLCRAGQLVIPTQILRSFNLSCMIPMPLKAPGSQQTALLLLLSLVCTTLQPPFFPTVRSLYQVPTPILMSRVRPVPPMRQSPMVSNLPSLQLRKSGLPSGV